MEAKRLEESIRAHLAARDLHQAATEAIRGYGPEVLGYLTTLLRNEDVAWDVFGRFSEKLWLGIAAFRGDASMKTWAYRIAWSCAQDWLREARHHHERPFFTGEFSALAAEVRATSRGTRSTNLSDLVARVRSELTPEEQTLLILRVDRGLSWPNVALVLVDGGAPVEPATLRKRYERLRQRILERVAAEKRRKK